MEKSVDSKLSINKYTKILVPATSYNIKDDARLLIPFTSGEKIGFVNKEGVVVVKPQYAMYYGECYVDNNLITVAVNYSYGFIRSDGKVAIYQRPLYGLLNSKGEVILPTNYFRIIPAIGNKKLFTLQDKNYRYGVFTADGEEIVPLGKYHWIDGFDNGLARVKKDIVINGIKNNGSKWGLIDENGKEILPIEYDDIWNFYGKERTTTKIVKDGVGTVISFKKLLGIEKQQNNYDSSLYNEEYDDYGTHYDEYVGTYAQDVEGYSDEVIDDAFDGEPDAYWNID